MPRELIDTGTDKRFVRRDGGGRFDQVDDVGRSLARDTRTAAKKKVKAGEGDRGDRRTAGRGRATGGQTSSQPGGAARKTRTRRG